MGAVCCGGRAVRVLTYCLQSPEWCHVRPGDWDNPASEDVTMWGHCEPTEDLDDDREDRLDEIDGDRFERRHYKGPQDCDTSAFTMLVPNGHALVYPDGPDPLFVVMGACAC